MMTNRKIRIGLLLAMCSCTMTGMAQTEEDGRIVLEHDTLIPPVVSITESPIDYHFPALSDFRHTDISNSLKPDLPQKKPDFKAEAPKLDRPSFRLWEGSSLNVSGSNAAIPGLMSASMGTLSLTQDIGNISLTASALAYKQWTPSVGGVHTMYGVGGLASWRLSDNVTLHTFGSYYPGMAGGYAIGGYADIRFSEHWGAELGTSYEYNAFTHQRRFDPIVTPYYRFNDGTKLHIPIGPFVRQGFMELSRMLNGH